MTTQRPSSLTPEQNQLLLNEFDRALYHTLHRLDAVYLDGFGLLFPDVSRMSRGYVVDNNLAVRDESRFRPMFEKCSDPAGLCIGDFRYGSRRVQELRDISRRIYSRLPVSWHTRLSEKGLNALLRDHIMSVRADLIRDGIYTNWQRVGTLLAINNVPIREGHDPFHSADIFLAPHFEETTQIHGCSVFEQPTVGGSMEVLSAAYGDPFDVKRIRIHGKRIEICTFLSKNESASSPVILRVCTDGLRFAGPSNLEGQGREILMELCVADSETAPHAAWPTQLIEGAAAKVIREYESRYVLASYSDGAFPADSALRSSLIFPHPALCGEYKCETTKFRFDIVVGITRSEELFAQTFGPELLKHVLVRRGAAPSTPPNRRCSLGRSNFTVPEPDTVEYTTQTAGPESLRVKSQLSGGNEGESTESTRNFSVV